MDWPQINIVAFSLLVAALCILVPRYVRRRSRSEEAQALVYDLRLRFILLQEFRDTQPSLPFLYEGEEWRHFYEKIKRVLENIQVAAGEKQEGKQMLTTKRVSTVIDGHLLRYLHSQPKLAEMVQEYLPAPGQSWATFLRGKEEQYSDLESDSMLFQVPEERRVEALECVLDCVRVLVDSFLDDLKQIDSSISDATRGDTGSTSKRLKRGMSEIKVYYATDRTVTTDGEYTKNRSKRNGLHYGYMVVGIPGGDRKLGQEADPGKNEEADPLKHIVIFTVVTLLPECENRDDKEGFVTNLKEALQSDSSENALLLYIHGFNSTHKRTIKTAARLKHDLEFKGRIIVYCWSSYGNIYTYGHDELQIKKTVVHLQDFIKTILNIDGKPDIHIVAHSMGNRALIEALRNIQSQDEVQPTLKNLVFVAADETREKFDDMVCKLQTNNQRLQQEQQRSDVNTYTPQLTVYSSTDDSALALSKFVHMEDRLGSTFSFLNKKKQDKGSDQIDVSGPKITKSWLHHSYHVQVPKVLQDIGDLLLTNDDAHHRSEREVPLITRVSHRNKDLFAYDADFWKLKDQKRCF